MKIALVAHNAKKTEILRLSQTYRDELAGEELFSTKGTGQAIQQTFGLKVKLFNSGPEGGDVEIANMILNDNLDVLVFLVDGMSTHPHEYDIQMLIRIATSRNTVIATNYATAAVILDSMKRHSA